MIGNPEVRPRQDKEPGKLSKNQDWKSVRTDSVLQNRDELWNKRKNHNEADERGNQLTERKDQNAG